MSLRFILGPAGAGKTHLCVHELATMIDADALGSPLLFIVPQQATFINERLLAETCAAGGFCRAEVTSFSRLIRKAAKENGEQLPAARSEAGKLLLMRSLIRKYEQQLQVFAGAVHRAGFAAQLVSAAEEMQVYGVSALQLQQAAQHLASSNQDTAERLLEISLLYAEYEQAVGSGGYAERMAYLAQSIRAGYCANAQVYIDGYAEFTPCEMEVISAFLEVCPRVSITLCLDSQQADKVIQEEEPFYPTWRTYGRIQDLAMKLGVTLEPAVCLHRGAGRFAAQKTLSTVESLFAGESVPAYCSNPEGLRLWTANDRELELEAVAREICRLVREEGLHYRDISVLCRDTACYDSLLSDTFGRAQIPYFIDSKKLLLYHPLVELLRAVLEVWAEKPGYRPMFRLLKNPLSPIFGGAADLLENYCLAHGVRFYHWSRLPWQFPLLREDAETEALVAEVNEIASLAVGPIMKFLSAVGSQSSAVCFHTAFNQLLADWQVQNRLEALIDAALAAGDGDMAAEYAQAQKLLLDFFAEAEVAMGEVELSGEEMRDLYETALSGLTFSTIPPGLDQVMIGSLERSRNPEIRAEFLLGVVEGELPRRIVMDGLFRDADRQLLATQGIQLAKDSKSLQFGENYLTYIGLTRSSERLYVSYPQNVEGQACQPSPLVRRLLSAFPQLVLEKVGFVQDASLLLSGAAEISTMAAGLRRNPLEPLWQAVYQHYASHSAYAEALKQVRYGLYFSANRQPMSKGLLRRMHGGTLRGSVSRLERFRRCPFSYFAAYGLKLQQRREFGLTASARGDLYHYVLSSVGLYLRERKIPWEQVDEQLAELLVDRVLNDCLPQFLAGIMSSSSRYAYLSHRLKRALVAAVLLVARQLSQGAFIPVAYELPFGNIGQPDALPAFYLKLPDGRHMELSGRIDRVDIAEDVENGIAYFRIIDYKTGQASINSEDIAAGLKLQLLLYLQVVLANSTVFTGHAPAPAGAYYITVNDALPLVDTPDKLDSPSIRANGLSVDDANALQLCDAPAARPRSSKSLLSVEQLDALREQLTAVLQETATAMLDGIIEVSPLLDKVDNACKYCDYQAVCCFDRQLAKSRRRMEPLPQEEERLTKQGNGREDEA